MGDLVTAPSLSILVSFHILLMKVRPSCAEHHTTNSTGTRSSNRRAPAMGPTALWRPSEDSREEANLGRGSCLWLVQEASRLSPPELVMVEMGLPICLSQKTKKSLKTTLDPHSHQRSQVVTTAGHDVHTPCPQKQMGGGSFPVITFIHKRSWGWVSIIVISINAEITTT